MRLELFQGQISAAVSLMEFEKKEFFEVVATDIVARGEDAIIIEKFLGVNHLKQAVEEHGKEGVKYFIIEDSKNMEAEEIRESRKIALENNAHILFGVNVRKTQDKEGKPQLCDLFRSEWEIEAAAVVGLSVRGAESLKQRFGKANESAPVYAVTVSTSGAESINMARYSKIIAETLNNAN